MSNVANEKAFEQLWPKCFVTFAAVVELLAAIILLLSELGNVAANFWIANVFAGGWGGLIILIHALFVMIAGCCSPGRPAAFRAVILALLGLIASAAVISFDVAFLIRPQSCLLTPECLTNAYSNSSFSRSFQQSFLTVFRNVDLFKSYTESQIKFLFQSIQVGVAAVCFLICIIYLIVFYVHDKKAKQQVGPQSGSEAMATQPAQPFGVPMAAPMYPPSTLPPVNNLYPNIPPDYYPPRAVPPLPNNYYAQPAAAPWAALPRIPQAQPGEVPWNSGGRRY